MRRTTIPELMVKSRRAFRQFTWGGEWALALSAQVKHNLTSFFFDGLFASASDNITVTYLGLYILAMGATGTQIGLMSSLSSLAVALVLLPGALLVERFGHRKQITLMFGGGLGRLLIMVLAVLPFMLKGQVLIILAIGLSILRDINTNLSFPAWMSVTGEIVPMEGRGRFFGSRNFAMGVAGMLIILGVGELITRAGSPQGYQVALGLAFIFGLCSTYSFSRIQDPKGRLPSPARGGLSFKALAKDIREHPIFLSLSLVMVVWNFGLNIAGPFFNVYMVQDLKFSATLVGLASIFTTVSSLLIQRKVGHLSDRLGARRVMFISMALIPILPAAWMFVTQFWHVALLNIFGGVVWGAFNLVSFNFLLSLMPEAQRARYSAIYQILVTLALALGAAVGSWLVSLWGYQVVFAASAVGRVIAVILFARYIPKMSAAAEFALSSSSD